RVCVPETSTTKRTNKYCGILDKPDSKATCVLAQSRLDCLSKILKGKADFGLFEAEDLVIAANYNKDESVPVLVTNEFQYLKKPFSSEMVAIVRRSANITRISQLQGQKLCLPGYGHENEYENIMSKFFEARVVPQMCDSDLSITENRIKSSSQFFKAACRAGPWVPDRQMDLKLKLTYSNLCRLCSNRLECSRNDQYWGKLGPMYCLTDGAGDVAWARIADIQNHFQDDSEKEYYQFRADSYRLLCADNRLAPVDKPENCAWLARPWKAVLAIRDVAMGVQQMLTKLKDENPSSWQMALGGLLDIRSQNVVPLRLMVPPEDYLQLAPGFLSVNSLSHCEPNGEIKICTRSNIEMLKCDWLSRAADVYGVEPRITCLKAESTEDCMKAVKDNIADVVTIQPDDMSLAYRNFGLKPVLYEYTKNITTVNQVGAIVRKESKIKHIGDLKGTKACFPSYDGVGWNSIWSVLKNKSLVPSTCSSTEALGNFFSDSCVPGISKSHSFPASLQALCDDDVYDEELGALRCLASGKGDVAFIQLNTLTQNTDGKGAADLKTKAVKMSDFKSLCLSDQTRDCYLSWSAPGQVLISSNTSAMKKMDIYLALMELGNLFDKHNEAPTAANFKIFAPFDKKKNVLFQDVSYKFEDFAKLQQGNSMVHYYETMLQSLSQCSSAQSLFISSVTFLISILVAFVISV
ncbi:hypothetical protein L9F63_021884, partial [Diploptera punctata]